MRNWICSVSLAVFLGILLLGCPPPQAILLFNDSGQSLMVEHHGGRVSWDNGQILRIGQGGEGIAWDELDWRPISGGGATTPVLTVVRFGRRLEYPLLSKSLPSEFVNLTGRVVVARYQLEPDGRMYAVPRRGPFPATDMTVQPPGFPIEPVSGRGAGTRPGA